MDLEKNENEINFYTENCSSSSLEIFIESDVSTLSNLNTDAIITKKNDQSVLVIPQDISFSIYENIKHFSNIFNRDMYLEKKSDSLELEINSAILRRNNSSNCVKNIELYQNNLKSIKILEINSYNLSGEDIKAFDIFLEGNEITVIDDFISIYNNNIISIYKWDSNIKLSKIKVFKTHLLLFYIKSNLLSKNSRIIFYTIILTLIKQKIKRIDSFLEGILLYLDIDNITDMEIIDEKIIIKYKNSISYSYDLYLNRIDTPNNYNINSINTSSTNNTPNINTKNTNNCTKKDILSQINTSNTTIIVKPDIIEINHKEKSFFENIKVPNAQQCVYTSNYMFLLCDKFIRVLKFL
ncbi:hypothetical protein CWI38_0926p0010 [Hamiltosporidium tvaerminnensis]|uniref:Uncharacterized protein n=1 Tax=Hamiltosporidium tvaerminnensis TaxID=1176355 RepID=A0A4Q9L867_9MICR|nr:hypothetical protein LUQ84_003157 [Hamiltosporidium tvaerminnensis]TBU03536.1 hypothetical protein CWI37_0279p0020 [Hamiltosporidium tvaerminnensis]TBU12036.1 hypothetical protein CWI38_0926p0010 [Hamiltosporidium tvaerminnensis]